MNERAIAKRFFYNQTRANDEIVNGQCCVKEDNLPTALKNISRARCLQKATLSLIFY